MSEADQDDWADEAGQAAEMPSVKLFGRWSTDDIAVGAVGTEPNRPV